MNKNALIYVAGHRGLVGSALLRKLNAVGYNNIIVRDHAQLDLINQKDVNDFFHVERPTYVFLAAAKVGGIWANSTYPADFIYKNIAIQTNVIDAAYRYGVQRMLFLGSSCIYPRDCIQPMQEEYFLTGPLEKSHLPYAIAKIAGIEMCRAYNRQYGTKFLSVMPTNLYGPNDNYNLDTSHVLPALLRKLHEAKITHAPDVTIWGTGKAHREFLYVDDFADACNFIMNLNHSSFQNLLDDSKAPGLINVGSGEDLTIDALVNVIANIVGFEGNIKKDLQKSDGVPRKLLDTSRLNRLGWGSRVTLEDGLQMTYRAFLK